MYSFSYLEPVCCSMSSSNCCFLTCIQVSQEAGQVVCYSHHFQNFPQFIVIHIVKGFGIVNKAEIDVFLEVCCLFNDPIDVGKLVIYILKINQQIFVVIQSLSPVQLFVTPSTTAYQASLIVKKKN